MWSGLSVDEIWDRLERGELSAVVYAMGDGMSAPGWRAVPSAAIGGLRAGVHDLIEWESLAGRVISRCDLSAIRVMPLAPDLAALRRPRKRVTGLRAAVEAAWDDGLPIDASPAETMAFLGRHDASDRIKPGGSVVVWLDDQGCKHETSKKSLANSLPKWREAYLQRPRPVA